jgi:hypothetical protein
MAFKIQQYSDVSDSDESEFDDSSSEEEKRSTRKKVEIDWEWVMTYDNIQLAEQSIDKSIFSHTYTNKNSRGYPSISYYRCRHVPTRSKIQCSARIYLQYFDDKHNIAKFKTTSEHDHEEINNEVSKKNGLTREEKKEILKAYDHGATKPKQILKQLQKTAGISRHNEHLSSIPSIPKIEKIANFLKSHKRKLYGDTVISIGDLKEWAEQKKYSSDIRDHQPFVMDSEFYIKDGQRGFRISVSSVTLLSNAAKSRNICADGTYKLNWNGFPVIVTGSTDHAKAFHPSSIGFASNETCEDYAFFFNSIKNWCEKLSIPFDPLVLISDASEAITNGFNSVFKKRCNVMCYAHMKRCVDKKVEKIVNAYPVVDFVKYFVPKLQICPTPQLFEIGINFFIDQLNKYSFIDQQKIKSKKSTQVATTLSISQSNDATTSKLYENNQPLQSTANVSQKLEKELEAASKSKEQNITILEFSDYFEDFWSLRHPGWYEGHCPHIYVPSTNNALESTNRYIKENGTFRERMPMNKFLEYLLDQVFDWSYERDSNNSNSKIFSTSPNVDDDTYVRAYRWAKLDKNIYSDETTANVFYFASLDTKSILVSDLKRYVSLKYNHWSHFTSSFDIYKLIVDPDKWQNNICTCGHYLKHYHCKHSIGISLRNKTLQKELLDKIKALVKKDDMSKELLQVQPKRGRPTKAAVRKALIKD